MGYVHAEITLRNAVDIVNAKCGIIREQDIRETAVTALVDTGAKTLVITEALREKLGLILEREFPAKLADGSKRIFAYSGPVQIQWKDRDFILPAIVVPDGDEVLLGVLPLEALDLIVDPIKQELVGAHGDKALYRI